MRLSTFSRTELFVELEPNRAEPNRFDKKFGSLKSRCAHCISFIMSDLRRTFLFGSFWRTFSSFLIEHSKIITLQYEVMFMFFTETRVPQISFLKAYCLLSKAISLLPLACTSVQTYSAFHNILPYFKATKVLDLW